MMQRLTIFACLIGGLVTSSGFAQEPHHPKISVVHQGVGRLQGDLKALIDLTTPEEQEQWENVKDYLDVFAIGVDQPRPLRVDILAGIQPTTYQIWIPYVPGEFSEFRDNLDLSGIEIRRDPQDALLFALQPPDPGWLRDLQQFKYAAFVFTTKADDALLKQLLMKAGDPAADIGYLIGTKASVGAQLLNTEASEEAQQKRRDAFAELRSNSMDAVQKRPAESETEFQLRKSALAHQLDEVERLMVEAERMQAWINLDREANTAALQFVASAIPDTSLATALAEFNQQPDAFASVGKLPESVLSVRVNYPIDALRQKNVGDFLDLLDKDIRDRVEASDNLEASQKEATVQLYTGLAELIREGVGTGYINGFLESRPDGEGDFISVGAVSLKDAPKLRDVLPRLADANAANTVELNVDTVGDIEIHSVMLAAGYVELFDKLFGVNRKLYVGTAEGHVWLASGKGSLDLLKKMIEELGEPAETPSVLHTEANLFPWVKRLKEIADKEPQPENPEERQQWRDRLRRLAQAVEAMPENDQWTFDMTAPEDNKVQGTMTFDTGLLRFVGKQVSEFSKENLSE